MDGNGLMNGHIYCTIVAVSCVGAIGRSSMNELIVVRVIVLLTRWASFMKDHTRSQQRVVGSRNLLAAEALHNQKGWLATAASKYSSAVSSGITVPCVVVVTRAELILETSLR